MDGLNDILLIFVTASATIVASVVTQILMGRQKRNNFLKQKSWGPLLQLVTSLSKIGNHLDKALNPWDKTTVNLGIVHECFQEMVAAQPYVYMTGRNEIIKSFTTLYLTLDFIESQSSQSNWDLNVKNRFNELPGHSMSLIKSISFFMSC